MGEHAYLQRKSTHMRETLSTESTLSERVQSTTSPTTVAYTAQDHPGIYTSMAAYNTYPMSYDSSSLPTPVSGAGSPSLPEGASSGMAHSFSRNGSTSQQPTPPGTARPNPSDWFNPSNHQNHHHIPSSQSPSPMTMHPDILEMHGLESSRSPENTVIPVTTADQCYFGRYGVSEQQEDMSPTMSSQAMFANIPSVVPSALIKNPLLSSPHMPLSSMSSSPMTLASLAPAPPQGHILHAQTNHGHMGRVMTPIEDLHHPYGLHNPLTMFDLQPPYSKRASRAKATKRGEAKRRPRGVGRTALPNRSRRASHASHAEDANASRARSTSPGHGPRDSGTEEESLQLKDDAPVQDRFLLDIKKEMIRYKGKDMWERIGEKWAERYDPKDRAALQMQVQRAVLKHAIWPESEDRILLEAVEEYDKRRYAGILKIMKERGGSKIWEWKDLHIIKRLAELGEEEFNPQGDGKKARRSRQKSQRRQSAVNLWPPPPNALYDEEGLSIQTQARMSSEEEDQLLQNLFKLEAESPGPDMMQGISDDEPSLSHASGDMDMTQSHSERVAKQACDQMIALHQRSNSQFFSRHPMSGDPNQYNHMS